MGQRIDRTILSASIHARRVVNATGGNRRFFAAGDFQHVFRAPSPWAKVTVLFTVASLASNREA